MTGYWILLVVFGGMAHAGWHVHLMNTLGIVMAVLFVYLYSRPYRGLLQAVAASEWEAAATSLGQIRRVMTVNLALGLVTSAVAAGGRYL